MKEEFKLVQYKRNHRHNGDLSLFSLERAKKVLAFHSSFPTYSETPLVSLKNTAKELGLGSVYIKDESHRFGLNAFKVLGGSFAIGSYLAQKLGRSIENFTYSDFISDRTRQDLGEVTFVTATDGNHGRGVAWTAKTLQQKSVVYMPKGSAMERLENILAEGAKASITEMNYDDAVRFAHEQAEEKGWIMVQDTAWEGYADIPLWIMQGYGTMAYEAYTQLPERPTHIFLQAGVGSLAGAVTAFFAALYKEECPIITIVEPNKADCLFQTAQAKDGKLHYVTGDMDTIMAGLACGEPCSIGWEILKEYGDNFISCPDYVAAQGMRILGNPIKGDASIISGESGAATFGCVAEIMRNPALAQWREKLKLNEDSRVLCFSTEGDTDREGYRSIVWDGTFPRT
ncbi:diaminopropionate ammonia-lyase [Anaerotignum sp. MB30-C6]|uniref:diaminopropionate ammonia-lyase n=1 Tax=Anaerotignum sp. MB30-C6 TaxID=3070814 RepID=UPI0027DDC57D|nr:diaminopropionate ammonia-lyase [Anaerotignum sp. MB30-C6]WMI81638.1 diaminopropionate ammonia-lyase [Anaerotignum sp. MB30-C6]